MVAGTSYYHKPQRLGRVFSVSELEGYYNDLTTKTEWTGESDGEGIPLVVLANGHRVHFAITIVQKALGHWDRWLLTQRLADKEEFLCLSSWLLSRQDERGGWPVWSDVGASSASPYSAMAQGECISAFIRAWKITGKSKYIEGARRALHLLELPVNEGGTAIYNDPDVFLEEIPSVPHSLILNGWIFALFGLRDFWLGTADVETREFFLRSLATLKRNFQRYDAGFWSCYDLQGHLASPFYHDLHIHQLRALAMIDNDPIILAHRDRWSRYRKNLGNRVRAFCLKAAQKLREPGEVTVIR
jgi:heparosan-N-sulfate-glucuronate 5-epimerase